MVIAVPAYDLARPLASTMHTERLDMFSPNFFLVVNDSTSPLSA